MKDLHGLDKLGVTQNLRARSEPWALSTARDLQNLPKSFKACEPSGTQQSLKGLKVDQRSFSAQVARCKSLRTDASFCRQVPSPKAAKCISRIPFDPKFVLFLLELWKRTSCATLTLPICNLQTAAAPLRTTSYLKLCDVQA